MSKYIVYCLNTNNKQLDIISIEDDEKVAKNIQNSHSFNLLCDLNKNKSLYKLEIKNNIIQIIEINIDIKNGWISNTITENKQSIYEIGIINYFKKEKMYLDIKDINESYVPGNNKIETSSINQNIIPRVPSVILQGISRGSNTPTTPRLVNKMNEQSEHIINKKNNKANLNILLMEELKKKCQIKF